MEEEILDWGLEFEKIKDKDDLRLILEDTWFLSDMDLMARVADLFDLSGSDPSLSTAVASPGMTSEAGVVNLKRSLTMTKKDEDYQRYSRPTKRVCKESDRVRVRVDNKKGIISTVEKQAGVRQGDITSENTCFTMNDNKLKKFTYAGRVEKSKLRDYNHRSEEQGVIKGDNVSGNTGNENKKRSRDDAVQEQLSDKEILEKSKLKLQEGCHESKDGRKKTCLISFSEIPKENVVPKPRKNHYVSRTTRGY